MSGVIYTRHMKLYVEPKWSSLLGRNHDEKSVVFLIRLGRSSGSISEATTDYLSSFMWNFCFLSFLLPAENPLGLDDAAVG